MKKLLDGIKRVITAKGSLYHTYTVTGEITYLYACITNIIQITILSVLVSVYLINIMFNINGIDMVFIKKCFYIMSIGLFFGVATNFFRRLFLPMLIQSLMVIAILYGWVLR